MAEGKRPTIVIPTLNRQGVITTARYLDEGGVTDYYVQVHTEEQRRQYIDGGLVRPETLVVSGVATGKSGLPLQRNWAMENLAPRDGWILFLDDDAEAWYTVDESRMAWAYSDPALCRERWLEIADEPLASAGLLTVCSEMIALAEANGIRLCGFMQHLNALYLMRKCKYSTYGRIHGFSFMLRNGDFRIDPRISSSLEDVYTTGYHLAYYGALLNSNWTRIASHKFGKIGGIGTWAQRKGHAIPDFALLEAEFPGLFKVVAGEDKKGDIAPLLALKPKSSAEFAIWRKRFMGEFLEGAA